MSSSKYEVATPPASAPATRPGDPLHAKSPSYPRRVHVDERGELRRCSAAGRGKIAEARASSTCSATVGRPCPASSGLYAQMLGARDQVAEAVRRMPIEAGCLYEEDKHRLHEAVAALERLFKEWA